jgi:hypothetical protein
MLERQQIRADRDYRERRALTNNPRDPGPGRRLSQVRLRGVGTLLPDHDVTDRQILGRAMQSITTMIPV